MGRWNTSSLRNTPTLKFYLYISCIGDKEYPPGNVSIIMVGDLARAGSNSSLCRVEEVPLRGWPGKQAQGKLHVSLCTVMQWLHTERSAAWLQPATLPRRFCRDASCQSLHWFPECIRLHRSWFRNWKTLLHVCGSITNQFVKNSCQYSDSCHSFW